MGSNALIKLLLVEDEALIASNGKKSLEEYGYTVFIAMDADEAVLTVNSNNIDLILMDIDLGQGKTDGIKTAARILKNYDIPVIFLSGHTDPDILERAQKITSYGYIVKNTDIAVIDTIIKTALKLAVQKKQPDSDAQVLSELEKTRLMLNDVLNTIPVRVFWKDLESVYMGCNQLFALDSGKDSPDDIVGFTDYDIRSSVQAELNRIDDRSIIESGNPRLKYEEPFLTQDGNKNWIVTSKIPLRNSSGVMYGILGMYEDITERKRMEEEIILQKNRLANILYGSNVGTWEWNVQTGENIVNEHWAAIIGYTLDELPSDNRNSWKKFVHREDLEIANALLEKHFNNELDYFECEFRMRHKHNHWIWVLSRGKVSSRTEDGKPLLVCGTHLDINERKLIQDEILNQLSEKQIILKEAHHRIKNNISSISSLLSLQAETIDNWEAKAALQDAIGRVRSMQILYEKLLIADDCMDTSLKHYLEDLVDDVIDVFPDRINIKVEKQICDCRLNSRQIFPLGIIVNEIITNILKYAFTDRESGVIRIKAKKEDKNIILEIQDNGNGLPEDFDIDKQDGFGLMLIRILCQQLDGYYQIENSAGVRSILKFKIPDSQAAVISH